MADAFSFETLSDRHQFVLTVPRTTTAPDDAGTGDGDEVTDATAGANP